MDEFIESSYRCKRNAHRIFGKRLFHEFARNYKFFVANHLSVTFRSLLFLVQPTAFLPIQWDNGIAIGWSSIRLQVRPNELLDNVEDMSDTELTKGSVSGWIAKMRQGDPVAIEKLVARYFKKIANFADKKLRRGIRVLDDGEDIAISVLQSITSNSGKGQFPNLQDRDDLWLMMIMIAQHDVIDKQRSAARRDCRSESTLTMTDLLETCNIDLELFLSQEDSHTRLMEIAECWEGLLNTLPDDRCREIASLKIKGHSNLEIARLLVLIPKTVDRKIKLIVQRWNHCFSKYFDS